MNGEEQTQETNDNTAAASGSGGMSVSARLRNWLPARPEFSVSVDTHTKYVLALSFALFVGFSGYLSLRYWSYLLTGSDFGSYVHMFATTLAGDVWLEQGKYIASHPSGSYWGGHFSLTLLAFIPLYALVSSPLTLIVIKSFVLAASVVALWVLARDRLESSRFALLVTVSYALNPFLWSAWLFDFQEQILLPPLLFGTYYAYANAGHSRIWRILFIPLLALVLLTNEFVTILVAGFLLGAAVAAYRNDRLRERLPLLAGGAVMTVAVRLFAGWVISQYSVSSGIPPASIAGPIRSLVEGSRATIGELVIVLLSNPAVIFETLAAHGFQKAVFVIMLFVPVFFLALRDETTIGALAPFLAFAWLFTGRQAYYTFSAHYPLYLLPFVYIGTVRVLAHMETEHSLVTGSGASVASNWQWRGEDGSSGTDPASTDGSGTGTSLTPSGTLLSRLFVVVLLVSAVGAMAVVADKHEPLSVPDEHDEVRSAALDMIPKNTPLVTQNDLFPHVAERPNATYIPNEGTFNEYRQKYGLPTPEFIVYDTTEAWSKVVVNEYSALLGTKYGAYAHQDGVWIWKRGYHGSPSGITREQPGVLQHDLDEFTLKQGTRKDGRIVSKNGPTENIWYGPKTELPPGTYSVTFRMNATRAGQNADGPVARVDVVHSYFHQNLAKKRVMPTQGTENVTVEFTLNQPRNQIEFRGFRTARDANIELESVDVERIGPSWAIGDLDVFGVNNGERRNGTIVSRNASPGQIIWYGPYTTLPAGTYTVAYEVNATGTDADTTDGPIATVDVATGGKHRRIAREPVRPTNGFETVRLNVTLHRTRRLVEFRGLSTTRNGTVALRSVDITRTANATKRQAFIPPQPTGGSAVRGPNTAHTERP